MNTPRNPNTGRPLQETQWASFRPVISILSRSALPERIAPGQRRGVPGLFCDIVAGQRGDGESQVYRNSYAESHEHRTGNGTAGHHGPAGEAAD